MSVRATERLVGDVVIVTGLPNSPLMVVQSVDEEAKLVCTSWFSDSHEYQEGVFSTSALDRAEPPKAKSAPKAAAKSVKSAAKPAAVKKAGRGRSAK